MINDRTYGFSDLKKELKRYDLDTVSDITGVPVKDIEHAARIMAENRPGTLIWAMGGTQHTNGTSNTRSYAALQLVLGNMARLEVVVIFSVDTIMFREPQIWVCYQILSQVTTVWALTLRTSTGQMFGA